jgi:CheY-like chemotaxis protein
MPRPSSIAPSLKTVLLVDDEAAVREIIARGLRRAGLDITAAPEGRQAIALLQERKFDLVITDICMPHGDGLELLTFMRTLTPRPPVIAMSGGGDEATAAQGLALAVGLGAGAPLVKPFTLQQLLDAIAYIAKSGAPTK